MTPAVALALVTEPPMIVASDLLGPLAVEPEELLEFPAGLLGFPECRRFVLLATERDGMYWLQSADHGALVFLLVDPFLFFPGYEVELGETELAELDAREGSDVVVLAIVTLPANRDEPATANLQGPLALNLRTRKAKQSAIPDSPFGVRCPLDLLQAVQG